MNAKIAQLRQWLKVNGTTNTKSVDEHIRQLYSARRLAQAYLQRAYDGDTSAMQVVSAATMGLPGSQYDWSRLTSTELRALQVLLKKAGNKPLSNSDLQHLEQIAAAAPNPYQLSSEDEDEHEPDAGGEESQTDAAEGRFQLDEFSLDAVNGSLSQKKYPARHRR